ncbi:MAG: DUF1801 domain-containing protein [Acidobacteriota bacterium]
MQSKASTVQEYLSSLPGDRRDAIERVRGVILENLDTDYEEGMSYGAIGYYVPHRVFPAGYHCDPRQGLPFAALASQKNYMSVYLMGLYCGCVEGVGDTALLRWFHAAWAASGKKLDMGKACLRFKKIEDLPLDVLGEAIRRVPARLYVEQYTDALRNSASARVQRKTPGKARPSKGAAAR